MATMQKSNAVHSLLIAEDDKQTLDVLRIMIASKFPDVTICSADNGKRGVEVFKECLPEIVITDINMPEMDGIEMASIIKSLKPDTKFIVLTAYSDKTFQQKFTEIGCSAYILKPIIFKNLFEAIQDVLPA